MLVQYREQLMSRVISPFAVIALIIAVGIAGIVVTDTLLSMQNQQLNAACERGPAVNRALERSKGKCFDRGDF
jgi:hypothetical protein